MYSKSLERHLYTATGGDNDFTNVTSLRGVFMTSVLAEGRTVIQDDSWIIIIIFFNGKISQIGFRTRLTRLLLDSPLPYSCRQLCADGGDV